MSETRRQMVVQAREGESAEREFERLYLESYDMVFGFVRHSMADSPAVEDVVSEAYLRAARSFHKYNPERAKFSTWVIKIATNCMRDYWRQARPMSSLDDAPPERISQSGEADALADRDLVERLLATLDDEERLLVVMKYREGFRNVDIAAELGMNASTVATKLANALKKMRGVFD